MCSVVPDGIVAFFPSYSYMEAAVAAWHELGVLREVLRSYAFLLLVCVYCVPWHTRQMEAYKLLFVETRDIVETTLSLANYK